MGVLRVKVGAAWIDIPAGPPGAGVPVGGALGTVLMKNSAADYDTVWTSTLTAPLAIRTATDTSGSNLTLGPQPGQVGDEGGQLEFAGGPSYAERMYLDRFRDVMRFVHGGTVVGGFAGTGIGFYLGTHPGHGTAYAGMWRTDRTAAGDYALLQGTAGDTYLNSATGQPLNFRIGNTQKMTIPVTGDLSFGSGMDGIRLGYGPRIYSLDATWVRMDNMFTPGEMRAVTVGIQGTAYMTAAGNQLRFNGLADGNHFVAYSSALPSQSGEGSNGPRLNGYSSVWLHQEVADKSLFLNSGGNAFLNSGNAWQTFSSRELKENIDSLDPEECLAMVRRWRPVRFDWKPEQLTPHPTGHGFIAEEMYETTRDICAVEGELSQRPGWVNGINYAGTTPWLAGAVQALAERIEQLERTSA